MAPTRDDPIIGVLAISVMAMILGIVLLVIGLFDAANRQSPSFPADRPVRTG
jgi:uncharacterized membrane protein YiaA